MSVCLSWFLCNVSFRTRSGRLFLCRFQAPVDEESEQLQDLGDDSTNDEAQARYSSSSRPGRPNSSLQRQCDRETGPGFLSPPVPSTALVGPQFVEYGSGRFVI